MNGEPHACNPDDGFGGATHQLETIHPIYYTSDCKPPREDNSNVLHGPELRDFKKKFVLGAGYQTTADLVYREFCTPLEKGGCNSDWAVLEAQLLKIEEPCWATIGQLWGTLHGKTPRVEELSCCVCTCPDEANSHEQGCTCVCSECVEYDEKENEPYGMQKTCTCECPQDTTSHEPHCKCACSDCVEYEECTSISSVSAGDHNRQWWRLVHLSAIANATSKPTSPKTVLELAHFLDNKKLQNRHPCDDEGG